MHAEPRLVHVDVAPGGLAEALMLATGSQLTVTRRQ
jgi:hypothetical protein